MRSARQFHAFQSFHAKGLHPSSGNSCTAARFPAPTLTNSPQYYQC